MASLFVLHKKSEHMARVCKIIKNPQKVNFSFSRIFEDFTNPRHWVNFLCRAKREALFRNLQIKGFPMVILLLFLHTNLIDLERFVNLDILQNIPNFN